jgi:adenosylhomocysteinase
VANDNFLISDINLAPKGEILIDWVSKWMPVLNSLYEKYKAPGSFKNKRIALCIHLEAKTAYLALIIKKLGAEVWITSSNPRSTKDEVAAALAKNGVHVFAKHAASREEYRSYLQKILEHKMDVIVDDGGDICEYLHEHPKYGENILGICEETTTGVNRLKELYSEGKLKYPAIAINDAKSKYLFDNRYGTGQSAWTAITHLTNLNIAGKCIVVVGYGWVGKGISARAKGLGAEVIVTEVDPWKALEARMEGCRVMPIIEAAALGDYFITTTGNKDVIRLEHIEKMHNGAFLANAGHFDFEIDIAALKQNAKSYKIVRDEVEEYELKNGNKIYVLAGGGIINIAGGLGHAADIMDMSFSVQLGCIHYFLTSGKLRPELIKVPDEIDRMVMVEKLKAEGIVIDKN